MNIQTTATAKSEMRINKNRTVVMGNGTELLLNSILSIFVVLIKLWFENENKIPIHVICCYEVWK